MNVQWIFIGYSLSFGPDIGGFIGGLDWIGLNNVGLTPHDIYSNKITYDYIKTYWESSLLTLYNILSEENDLILHGQKGRLIKARTVNQREIVKQAKVNDMLFAIGPAGTGKTYIAVAKAVSYLHSGLIK